MMFNPIPPSLRALMPDGPIQTIGDADLLAASLVELALFLDEQARNNGNPPRAALPEIVADNDLPVTLNSPPLPENVAELAAERVPHFHRIAKAYDDAIRKVPIDDKEAIECAKSASYIATDGWRIACAIYRDVATAEGKVGWSPPHLPEGLAKRYRAYRNAA